jgi:hypothetical protein
MSFLLKSKEDNKKKSILEGKQVSAKKISSSSPSSVIKNRNTGSLSKVDYGKIFNEQRLQYEKQLEEIEEEQTPILTKIKIEKSDKINYNGNVFVAYEIQFIHVDKSKGIEIKKKILKRYQQFRQLHKQISEQLPKLTLPKLPPKKLLGSTKPDFIEKRIKELNNYANQLGKIPEILQLTCFKDFINSSLESYNQLNVEQRRKKKKFYSF